MNLQTLLQTPGFSLDDLKRTVSQRGLVLKEWNDRVMVTYPNQSNRGGAAGAAGTAGTTSTGNTTSPTNQIDFSDPITKECRGIIIDKTSMKIVCYSMDKLESVGDCSDFGQNPQNKVLRELFEAADGITEELYDGSLIKLYWYDNQWTVATNRCIEARKARWTNYRTFADMFQDAASACNLDYAKLNPRHVYSFVLCHPENRIVVNYTQPKLIHIATRDLDTLLETDVNIGIEKPLQLKMDWDTFQERLQSNPYYMPGYVLKTLAGTRILLKSANYQTVKQIRGHTRDLAQRYLELKRNDTQTFEQFNMYFPEFAWIETRLETVAREVHHCYLEYFINHNKQIFSQRDLWELLSELHTLYLRTKEPTSLTKVRQHLQSYPTDKLARLLRGT